MPDSFRDRWDGRHWRGWAFLAGIALTVATVALAASGALLAGADVTPLVLLALMAELIVLSAVGSGMFDGLAGRSIAGGLARQPAPDERAEPLSRYGRRRLSDAERDRRDRRTIRAGLAASPVLATFCYLLFG